MCGLWNGVVLFFFFLFQFLIGRLDTLFVFFFFFFFFLFQFLIGRLDTKCPDLRHADFSGFQFLIGRLDTINKKIAGWEPLPVSIPHR